jgi:hypothetical protein
MKYMTEKLRKNTAGTSEAKKNIAIMTKKKTKTLSETDCSGVELINLTQDKFLYYVSGVEHSGLWTRISVTVT